MYSVGAVYGRVLSANITWRREQAMSTCLQPGASIKNLGPGHDSYHQFFARLEVTVGDEKKFAEATAADITDILAMIPPGQSEARTVLCQAREQALTYYRETQEQQARNAQALEDGIKNFFKKLLR